MNETKGRIFVISGPSACGKNTVYEGVLQKSSQIMQTVSATTRAPREGETNGVDYYFISREEFDERVANGDFVEYVQYGANYYGTLKTEVSRILALDKTVLLIIDVNGAKSIKEAFPEAVTVFLLPPSMEVLKKRIVSRGQNSPEEIACRLKIAEQEMQCKDDFDYRVVNDDLDVCIQEVTAIIANQ